MTANQIEQAIKQLISLIITWAKLIGGLALALIVLGSLAAAAGHAIPYLPRLPLDQGHGIAIAALAYYLGK